ncbi:MAG: hypothetical protein ACOC22_00670 [bacterium]
MTKKKSFHDEMQEFLEGKKKAVEKGKNFCPICGTLITKRNRRTCKPSCSIIYQRQLERERYRKRKQNG